MKDLLKWHNSYWATLATAFSLIVFVDILDWPLVAGVACFMCGHVAGMLDVKEGRL